MKQKLIFLIELLFLMSTAIIAQVPGKITGKIIDVQGDPLPRANVLVDDKNIGASSDLDGTYIILNISPGIYSITASFIGYQSVKKQNITVKPGLTTLVDFELPETTLELEETIVVTAENPLIQMDATTKTTTISAGDIEKLPIENLNEILSTQSNISVMTNTPNAKAGYNIRGVDDVRLRGSRSNEVALLIDGVKVSNPIFGGFGTTVSKNAINQVSIESGAYSAKYGNALSGVINLTTKEGSGKFQSSLRYYSSYPFDVDFLTNDKGSSLRLQNVQASISGNIPLTQNLTYFISGEVSTSTGSTLLFDDIVWDDYRNIMVDNDGDGIAETPLQLPTSDEIINGYLQYGNLEDIQTGLSQNWKKVVGPDGRKINPIDNLAGWTGLGWNNYYNFFGNFGIPITTGFKATLSALIDRRYRQLNDFDAWYDYNMKGQNIQILNSNKETLTLNHALSQSTFYTIRLSRFYESREIRILKDYSKKFRGGLNFFDTVDDNFKEPEEYIPYASSEAISDPFENSFYLLADNRWYEGDNSTNFEVRGDFTSQFHPLYMIEAGLQFNFLDINYYSYQNIVSVDPFPTTYNYTPLEGAVYTQLKAEFESIIFNFGARIDYLNSGGTFWYDPFDPLGEQDPTSDSLIYNPIVEAEPKWSLSPRVGVAYPLTANSVISFNFGHFYQNPNYRDMYRASGDNREVSLIRGNIIGNPNLKPEKAIQYELALQHSLTTDLAIKLNLWMKETTNQIGSVVVPAYSDPGGNNPFTYSVFLNNNFGSGKGLEITIEKRPIDNFGFYINYSLSEAKVLQADSWDGYWNGQSTDELPKQETIAPWDQTHVIRASFQYNIPNNSGPEIFGSHWFDNLNLSLVYYGESGVPYTPTIPGGVIAEPYSERWPFINRFDFSLTKEWRFIGLRFIGLLQVRNIFDTENVVSGYTLTGSATDPGTSSYYTRSSSYWDSRNNNNFGERRTFYIGFEFLFGSL